MDDQFVSNSSPDPLRFAEKLLALLDSGRFTATYKFATLAALIDVCLDAVGEDGLPPDVVPARQVGRRVFELLWRHSVAYTAAEGDRRYLRHSSQAGDLVRDVTAFRERHGFGPGIAIESARSKLPREMSELEDQVVVTVIRMPLPKLQRFGTGAGVTEDRFLYDYAWPDEVPAGRVRAPGFDDRLRLQPGVGGWLVRMAGVLRPIVQQRWAAFVADRSRDVVEAAWLDDFLFGSTRIDLDRVRGPLLEAQERSCFYCGLPATPAGSEVDHFIPWSRHPDNGVHNLVAAHRRCNNAKRDSLAATEHLRRWLARMSPDTTDNSRLTEVADELRWPIDTERAIGSARAIYLWLPEGTLLWQRPGQYAPADPVQIRSLLLAAAA